MRRKRSGLLCWLLLAYTTKSAIAFVPSAVPQRTPALLAPPPAACTSPLFGASFSRHRYRSMPPPLYATPAAFVALPTNQQQQQQEEEIPFFLKPYQMSPGGQVLDCYKTLRVSPSATALEIKQAYYRLSRQCHPDTIMSSCRCRSDYDDDDDNTVQQEQAREEFERVRFAYGILKDKTQRMRYDRHVAMAADPGALLGRAAWFLLTKTLEGMGRGLLYMGTCAVDQMQMGKVAAEQWEQHGCRWEPVVAAASVVMERAFAPLARGLEAIPQMVTEIIEEKVEEMDWHEIGRQFWNIITPLI